MPTPARPTAQHSALNPAKAGVPGPGAKTAGPKSNASGNTPPKRTGPGQGGRAARDPNFPPPLLLQADIGIDLQALRDMLAGAGLRDFGEILNDRINQPTNFYRFVYEQAAKRPRLIHPDHHPQLLPDYLAAQGKFDQAAPDRAGRALLILPPVRPTAVPATASVTAAFHRLVQQGKAQLIHVSTANSLRLLAARTPAQPFPLRRLLPLLRAQARQSQQRKAAFAQHPGFVELEISQICTADGKLTTRTRSLLGTLLGPDALSAATRLDLPNPLPLDQSLPNLADIRGHLQPTPFAWMAEDLPLPPEQDK